MASSSGEELAAELEFLTAMCSEDELRVEKTASGTNLVVRIAPMTAGDEDKQFLRCELQLHVGSDYPLQPPHVTLGGSRGLSDIARTSLLAKLNTCAEDLRGEPALFAVLEAGRTELTALNTPEGECAICLGSLSDIESEQLMRMPCYHVFHRHCMVDYCQSEISRKGISSQQTEATGLGLLCPECRTDIPCTEYPDLQEVIAEIVARSPEAISCDEFSTHDTHNQDFKVPNNFKVAEHVQVKNRSGNLVTEDRSFRHEAFIRLHHLHQGNDEKEKPLLRLLKELGLDAVVYYGKPALILIQGAAKDVEIFAGTAKRRHITITIDVAQRSQGPPVAKGITSVPARKSSLNSAVLREHLETRGLGETTFTIIGS